MLQRSSSHWCCSLMTVGSNGLRLALSASLTGTTHHGYSNLPVDGSSGVGSIFHIRPSKKYPAGTYFNYILKTLTSYYCTVYEYDTTLCSTKFVSTNNLQINKIKCMGVVSSWCRGNPESARKKVGELWEGAPTPMRDKNPRREPTGDGMTYNNNSRARKWWPLCM